MIVCVCHRVSDRDIRHHASQGCVSFDAIQMETGVATCCGRCESCAREVLDEALSAKASPTAHRPATMHVATPA